MNRTLLIGLIAMVATPVCADREGYDYYSMSVNITTGTFSGQQYTGWFEVNTTGLMGVGEEVFTGAVENLRFNPFGTTFGPEDGLDAVFVDGNLQEIRGVRNAAGRNFGFNLGFNELQVPEDIRNGAWFGYLNTNTVVDGFGSYDFKKLEVTHYLLNVNIISGTFAGQKFSGSLDVDSTGVTGVGEELLANVVLNLEFNPFGVAFGPVDGLSALFRDGELVEIQGVRNAAGRNFGFNLGFGEPQVPGNIRDGAWFGYLNTNTVVDGFGSYTMDKVFTRVNGWTFNGFYPWIFDSEHGWLYYLPTNDGIYINKLRTGEWILMN